MMSKAPPDTAELLAARSFLQKHYPRTPLYPAPLLSRADSGRIYVKLENHGPVRSFKARGALYRLSRLDDAERRRGVVTASTGNHGQGIAYAGGVLGIPATVVVPEGSPPLKTDNIIALGGRLRIVGTTLREAEMEAQALARRDGMLFIEDGDDAGLMAGAGTIAWEILEDLPTAAAIIVPVGGGNLIAGIALVAKRLRPEIRIIGVQSAQAPAVYRSWTDKAPREAECATTAGGLATSRPGMLAFTVLRELVDEMVLVSDEELDRAIVTVLETTGQIAEGAGAAPFAALDRIEPGDRDGETVLILSGGNLPISHLRRLLSATRAGTTTTSRQ
jgi:threonine dehydratase